MSIDTDYKEKEYECMALVKSHSELFTYDKHNDIYYSRMFNVAIGNKRQLQKEVEKYCKSENGKNTYGKLVEDYTVDDILVADFSKKNRCNILPIAMSFDGRNIAKQIEEMQHNRDNDKFRSDSVAAQFDNHLSTEEELEMHEANSVGAEKSFDDIEMGE
jgi:hypothetical protein